MRRVLISVAVVATATISVVAATAGNPPNLLDRHLGVVLPRPVVTNLYWDNQWDTRHQLRFTRAQIANWTRIALNGQYLAPLEQYGVVDASFAAAPVPNQNGFQSSPWCGPSVAPAEVTSAAVIAWLVCMVSNPLAGVPGPGLRAPVSNRLYVVYLPQTTTIVDQLVIPAFTIMGRTYGPYIADHRSCDDYGAYHAFAGSTTLFAFALVPARCAVLAGDTITQERGRLQRAMTHEIVEAAVNPLIGPGWWNHSLPPAELFEGAEAADICNAEPAPLRQQTVRLARYWSNEAGDCVAPTD
jgi:hypothetical protein